MTMYVHNLIKNGSEDAVAIVDQGNRITYKELQEVVAAYRDYLKGIGISKNEHVGIFAKNSAAFIYAYQAVVSLGAVAVPINFQLSGREIAFILQDAGIRHLLTYQELDLAEYLAVYGYDQQVVQHDIANCFREVEYPHIGSLDEELEEDMACAIIYTSGTTGHPKGAVLSHRNILTNIRQAGDIIHCNSQHKVLSVLPMYHCFGWTMSVLHTLAAGACVIIVEGFSPKETVEVIRAEQVTDLYVVPSICSLLTKTAEAEDLASVQLVISGGTTLPLKIAKDFQARFGLEIAEGYGLSEAAPVVAFNPPGRVKVGSIGQILPGIQYQLVDAGGQPAIPGQAGELVVKGDNVMLGYWNMPEATGKALRDGWLYTGDVARYDADGYLYIVDRLKDIIISMGENVYPREIEELVYKYKGISEAAVIGIKDRLRGHAGACYYVVSPGEQVDVRKLKRYLRKNLAVYKIPREFHEITEMPHTDTGKISKVKLLAIHDHIKEDA